MNKYIPRIETIKTSMNKLFQKVNDHYTKLEEAADQPKERPHELDHANETKLSFSKYEKDAEKYLNEAEKLFRSYDNYIKKLNIPIRKAAELHNEVDAEVHEIRTKASKIADMSMTVATFFVEISSSI